MGIAAGAPFSASHHVPQTGPLRQPTLDRHIENLVFCGANTQPGVGVPMVLVSGRLAAERVTGLDGTQARPGCLNPGVPADMFAAMSGG